MIMIMIIIIISVQFMRLFLLQGPRVQSLDLGHLGVSLSLLSRDGWDFP